VKAGVLLLSGGGAVAAAGAALGLAWWRSSAHTRAIVQGVGAAPAFTGGAGGVFRVRPTGYWPFTAREDEKKMEGGVHDRIGAPLYTVEDFLAGKSDHVSLSGDLDIFPYGQKLIIEGWPGAPNLVGRVTDTGGNFFNVGGLVKKGKASKVYRVLGEEPLDFCVFSSKTFVPKKGVTARIVPGDHWASRTKATVKDVDKSKFQGQAVVGSGLDYLGADQLAA
jgi:hypothetical protein